MNTPAPPHDPPKPRRSAMTLYAKNAYKRVCKMFGYALTLDDPQTWHQTAAIFNHWLTRRELVALAWAALSALEPQDRQDVFQAAHWGKTP